MPKGKQKKKNNKNIIKPVYHAFAYGIQTARNKLGKHINCPCTQSEIKVFAVSPRRSLGANTRVKRPGYVLIVSFMGCAGENQRKGIFSFAGIPLGYAWRNNNNNKKTKERKRTNESIWSKHKTQYIYIYISFIWLFVLEWYPLEVKENLDRAQEQVSCKCLHKYSRIVAL